ncbi:MAG: flavin reductase [Chloroflexi bacterium]|nr:flavin reductase [Chloroflexota bacterium]
MSLDSNLYRQVMRRFATGVAILTVRDGDHLHGMTANTFTSVSLDPILILVCIQRVNETHQHVTRVGHFALNILSANQRELAQRFAKQSPMPAEPFGDILYHRENTGAPILDDCIAYLDCRVVGSHEAGTHTIFIGAVQAAGFGSARDAHPLLWFAREYVDLEKLLVQN